MDNDLRIMRIRTKTQGVVAPEDMQTEWEAAQSSLKRFRFEHAIKSDIVVLTNTDGLVTTVIAPTSISKHQGQRGETFRLNGEVIQHDLVGQPDPAPNKSRQLVSYNWSVYI